jgi:hypothetical protein
LAREVVATIVRNGLCEVGRVGFGVRSDHRAAISLCQGLGFRKVGDSVVVDRDTGMEP